MTPLELITYSLTDLGEVGQGETISSEDSAQGLSYLNDLLNSLSNDRLNIPFISSFSGSMTGGVGTYTIGPSGGFITTSRPVLIQTAAVIISGISHSLELISSPAWNEIQEQALTGILPIKLWANPDVPNMTLNFWPRPSGIPTFQAYYWAVIQGGNMLLTDTFSLPAGYLRALRALLARDLAPSYGRQLSQDLQANLQDAYSLIRNRTLLDTLNANLPNTSPSRGEPVQQ